MWFRDFGHVLNYCKTGVLFELVSLNYFCVWAIVSIVLYNQRE